jgi:hypothetical protein
MIEKRTKVINKKRIKADYIHAIAKILQDEYDEFLRHHKHAAGKRKTVMYLVGEPSIYFRVEVIDGIEYSSDSMELFADGNILNTKVITQFYFKLSYTPMHATVTVNISDSRYHAIHYVEVAGSDRTWVNGTFARLVEAIDSWEAQNNIYKILRWPISCFLGILGSYFIGWLLTLPLPKPDTTSEAGRLTIYIFALIAIITFVPITFLFANYMDKLWPDIEIVPEPEHERKLDRSRNRLKYVVLAIVVPFLIAILANWIL